MHDAVVVRFGDGLQRLEHQIDRLADVDSRASSNQLREVDSLEHLQHHVRETLGGSPCGKHARNVLAFDARGRTTLVDEPIDGVRIAGNLRKEKLDGDPSPEVQVHRNVHRPHSPFANEPLDSILLDEENPGCKKPVTSLRVRDSSSGSSRPSDVQLFPSHGVRPIEPALEATERGP